MNSIDISIRPRSDEELSHIMGLMSEFNCEMKLNTTEKSIPTLYPFNTSEVSYTRIGERYGRTKDEYKRDMEFFDTVGRFLLDYGLEPAHKGFRYCIECVRLMNTYGLDDYNMVNDVYPIISKWYGVSINSVEHNIRNAIGSAWDRAYKKDSNPDAPIATFTRRPTNIKFLRHISNLTSATLGNNLSIQFM